MKNCPKCNVEIADQAEMCDKCARPVEQASAIDAIIPTNPLAAVSCYTGILSMVCCFIGIILGPIAILTGIMALKKWKMQESQYGKVTSTIRAWVGIITGILGTLIGIPAIIMTILSILRKG